MSTNDYKAISRQAWWEIREGTPFQQPLPGTEDYKEDFYGLSNSEGINFPKLVKFLDDYIYDCSLIFDWDNFDVPATRYQERNPDRFGPRTREVIKGNIIPFSYKNPENKIITASISGLLNKRKGYLEDEWGYRLNISAKDKIIAASLRYYYENTKDFRKVDKENIKTYSIPDKYVAISLSSDNLTDFCYLVKECEGENAFKSIQTEIASAYANKIYETKNAEELDFLYENVPNFVLEKIMDELLFEDLITLLKWDKEKWFKDGSNAMMNILLAFKKPKELYQKFEQDPSLVLKLYNEMDKENPKNFGEIMSVLGILFCSKERDKRNIKIPLSKKYVLDSDLFFNENGKTINLNVQEKYTVNYHAADDAVPGFKSGEKTNLLRTIATYPDLHPLDMVTIINENGTEQTVTAIYVKFLSDTAEKELIKETIIIIAEIVSIIVAAGTLAAGAGIFWSTMAIADIVLTGTDLALKVDEIKNELVRYEAGKWFVDHWDTIYGASGFVMLSTAAVKGILTQGPKLLTQLTHAQANLKNFIRSAIASAILQIEIANFTKNTFRYIPWEEIRTIKNIDNYGINGIIAQKMHKANVLMAVSEEAQTMALIYKGEAIAVGNGKSIKETLKTIFTWARKETEITKHLDELADFATLKKTETFLNVLARVQKKQYLAQYLSIEEEAVILYYTTSAYENLNKALRGLIELKKEYNAFKNLLNRALSKLPNSSYNRENNFLYRSFKMSDEEIKANFIEGKVYTEKAFLSTSHNYDNFINNWFKQNPSHNVIMKVQGKNGKLIEDVSDIYEESELLFKSGSQFEVISIRKIDNPVDFSKEVTEIILKEK